VFWPVAVLSPSPNPNHANPNTNRDARYSERRLGNPNADRKKPEGELPNDA